MIANIVKQHQNLLQKLIEVDILQNKCTIKSQY